MKLKRIELVFNRVNNTPKPKEPSAAKDEKKKKMPKNIKIDNFSFDGSAGGDINWEDIIKM